MSGVFKVVCINKGSRVCSESFKDFDSAFNYADESNSKNGYTCIVLELDFTTLKWRRRITMYPRESC